ncbi:MAG: nuclear transport factor 2 family protein [Burkholderiales bacterium]|nr:MAG: nuclear transport factor 2 family protein [Burkholderiales bacterium]
MSTNREIVTGIFDETAKGNGRPYADAMADDMEMRLIGSNSWSGSFHGKDTIIREIFAKLRDRFDGPNVCVPTRILVDGDFVVVQARGKNRTKSGKAYENDYCFVIRMENGKMAALEEYCDTELVSSALGER